MSNLSCGTHVAEPTANIDCRKLLNQSCRFLPKLKLPISADAKLPLTESVRPDTYRFLQDSSVTLRSLEESAKFCEVQRSLMKFDKVGEVRRLL